MNRGGKPLGPETESTQHKMGQGHQETLTEGPTGQQVVLKVMVKVMVAKDRVARPPATTTATMTQSVR